MAKRFLVVGAGFSGAVVAHCLATRMGRPVAVIDEREHIAGNCHTARDAATGVMLHLYGPHIFHTNHRDVWQFVNSLATFRPYIHRIKAINRHGVFTLPINLHTINQFFGTTFGPSEAEAFIRGRADRSIEVPQNFEEQALRMIGRDLYEAFFRGYTKKQWGRDPRNIPASVLQRLPLRFSYDDNYYNSMFQGIPEEGYTAIIARLLDHPAITVELGRKFHRADPYGAAHVFYTGPIDGYFGNVLGGLSYRTVTFERIEAEGDYQGAAQVNYTEENIPWTRITEHKHFRPWETHEKTVAFKEYSKETEPSDIPYYPVRSPQDKALLQRYYQLAEREQGVSFLGRLATYRYLDMDTVIKEALDFSHLAVAAIRNGEVPPKFSFNPYA